VNVSKPTIAAVAGSAALVATAVTDVFWRVPAGLFVLAGFAAFAGCWWAGIREIKEAVRKAIEGFLAGTQMEAALVAWPHGDNEETVRTERTLRIVGNPGGLDRQAKHRRES
jgi:hypothetical protein